MSAGFVLGLVGLGTRSRVTPVLPVVHCTGLRRLEERNRTRSQRRRRRGGLGLAASGFHDHVNAFHDSIGHRTLNYAPSTPSFSPKPRGAADQQSAPSRFINSTSEQTALRAQLLQLRGVLRAVSQPERAHRGAEPDP